jgi:hypothetical protein
VRTGPSQWLAELAAASGLLLTILLGLRFHRAALPWLVGLYITAASFPRRRESRATSPQHQKQTFRQSIASVARRYRPQPTRSTEPSPRVATIRRRLTSRPEPAQPPDRRW